MISSDVRRISACDNTPRGVAGFARPGLAALADFAFDFGAGDGCDFADLTSVLRDEAGMILAARPRVSPVMDEDE